MSRLESKGGMVNNNSIRAALLTSPLIVAFLLLINIGDYEKVEALKLWLCTA
jgi:hypothetical protein